ncbi:MAG: septum formation initiator, partial [Nonomuraea sp.]|nr:septum formation initiator [Nonomuraea sp.]
LRTARPAPSAPAMPEATGGTLIRTAGGTVTAACVGGRPVLRSWSPAQGYSVDDVDQDKGEVKFEPEEGDEVEVRLVCQGGVPVMLRR